MTDPGDGDTGVATDGGYEVTGWEPRTPLDRFAVLVYGGIVRSAHWAVILLALATFTAQLGLVVYGISVRPTLGILTLASILPAVVIVGAIWRTNPTGRDPFGPLAVTFLLSVTVTSMNFSPYPAGGS